MAEDRPAGSPSVSPWNAVYEEQRPWGGFRQYTHNAISTVKIITVLPGQRLSLQSHERRDELWIALTDGLQVTLGDDTRPVAQWEELFVPRGTRHRMEGIGQQPARWLEISFGEFDESDIVRYEDDFGRA